MEYIEKAKAIEALQKLIDSRRCNTCSRQRIIEAQAYSYAQRILLTLPVVTLPDEPQEAKQKTARRTAKKAAE